MKIAKHFPLTGAWINFFLLIQRKLKKENKKRGAA
jgi:hypothetical protein